MTTITETAARPSWVRPDDVCKMLSVSPRTLKRWAVRLRGCAPAR